jgi:hypothetical protein
VIIFGLWTIAVRDFFGPDKKGVTRHYKLTSSAFGGVGKLDGTELDIDAPYAEIGNYDYMDSPNVLYFNGVRTYPGERLTIYQDVEYTLSWINRNRTVTDYISMTSGDGQSYELVSQASDGYYAELRDGVNANHYLGVSFQPETDYVSEFTFTTLKFTCNALMAATNGDGHIYIEHRMFATYASGRPVYFEFTLADQPGVIADKSISYRIGFAVDFTFDSAIISI